MSPRRRRDGVPLLSRRTALGGLATGLVGLGAVSYLQRSGAFESVTGARGVVLKTTEDAEAFLAIDGITDPAVTPTYTNNADDDMDVTLDSVDDVEFDVGETGSWQAPPVAFALAAGRSEQVGLRVDGNCAGGGTAMVDIDATLSDDAGTDVGTVSLTREFDISAGGSGAIDFTGTARSAGGSGKYEFGLENTGCGAFTMVGIGINMTSTDADSVSQTRSLVNQDTNQELVSEEIPVDSSHPDNSTRRDLDPTVTLSEGETVTLAFNQFRRGSGGRSTVDMRDEDVRITVYLSDGSSKTIDLCLGSCDF